MALVVLADQQLEDAVYDTQTSSQLWAPSCVSRHLQNDACLQYMHDPLWLSICRSFIKTCRLQGLMMIGMNNRIQ